MQCSECGAPTEQEICWWDDGDRESGPRSYAKVICEPCYQKGKDFADAIEKGWEDIQRASGWTDEDFKAYEEYCNETVEALAEHNGFGHGGWCRIVNDIKVEEETW